MKRWHVDSEVHRRCTSLPYSTMGLVPTYSWTAFYALRVFFAFLFVSRSASASKISFSHTENGYTSGIRNAHRNERSSENVVTDCMTVTSEKGHYYYKAPRDTYGSERYTCGIYLMANADEVIQVHFDYIDMPCENNDVVSFVDGWELNGSYFPNDEDYSRLGKNRFREYCGKKRVKEVLESSQNAALIRYNIPEGGKGFSFYVSTRKNPTPCNILVESSKYVYTLRNYGQRNNCSLLAMNPAKIQILSLTVGISDSETNRYTETGTFHNCDQNGLSGDYVQIGGGTDLGQYSVIAESICGVDSVPGGVMDAIFCGVTKIRLVSSGTTNNIVTLTIDKVKAEEAGESGVLCPSASSD